ncbi:MAG: rhomboid family intramembrane serine protease [Anaerolineaceae bacterium]|nr:MAG: rhomboid family intramembrane serine protease [Anaerolineaceae bacterium]
MLPLKDLNPTRRIPVITYALIVINVLVFIWEQTIPLNELEGIFMRLSVVPTFAIQDPLSLDTFLDFIRSMFFHGGWAHLLGNMLYLWLFGDNLEDRMGVVLYLFLYFLGGLVASFAQIIVNPNSLVPMIGASGAIAGVLGGYLILFPGVRVRGIIPLGFFVRAAEWPAWAVLGLWFVIQLFNGVVALGVQTGATGGIAFFAHIGGFITGLVLTWIFMKLVPQPPVEDRQEVLYERAQRYRF